MASTVNIQNKVNSIQYQIFSVLYHEASVQATAWLKFGRVLRSLPNKAIPNWT